MPIHSGKAKVHFCLQIQMLPADQCELHGVLCKNRSATNILKDKTQPASAAPGIRLDGCGRQCFVLGQLWGTKLPIDRIILGLTEVERVLAFAFSPHLELYAVDVTSLCPKFDYVLLLQFNEMMTMYACSLSLCLSFSVSLLLS